MERLLQIGDVFKLETGMSIETKVEDNLIYGNVIFHTTKSEHLIIVGKTYPTPTEKEQKLCVQDLVQSLKHVINDTLGININRNVIKEFINPYIPKIPKQNFIFEPGLFIVVFTATDGGSERDSYPNGHHVFCKRLDVNGNYDHNAEEINFYQSGAFTHIIPSGKITLVESRELVPPVFSFKSK